MSCYAVKANGNLAVIRALAKLGAGVDVVSEGELRRALRAGVPPSRIVFSGVGKTRAEMAFALQRSEERRVGKEVSVRVDLGGGRIIKTKKNNKSKAQQDTVT